MKSSLRIEGVGRYRGAFRVGGRGIMQRQKYVLGPVALTTTYTTNLMNPGTTTGGVASTSAPYDKLEIILYHIRVINKDSVARTFRLYKGATGANAAGTELAPVDKSVPANDFVDLYYPSGLRFTTSDFLVGGAATVTTLVLTAEGEIGVA
jgi:hypothetical protein